MRKRALGLLCSAQRILVADNSKATYKFILNEKIYHFNKISTIGESGGFHSQLPRLHSFTYFWKSNRSGLLLLKIPVIIWKNHRLSHTRKTARSNCRGSIYLSYVSCIASVLNGLVNGLVVLADKILKNKRILSISKFTGEILQSGKPIILAEMAEFNWTYTASSTTYVHRYSLSFQKS